MIPSLILNFSLYLIALILVIVFFRKNYIAWMVFGLYALGSFCAIFIPTIVHYYVADIFISTNYSIGNFVYLFVLLCIFLIPVLQNGINYSKTIALISPLKNEILLASSIFYSFVLLLAIMLIAKYLLQSGFSFEKFMTSKDQAADNFERLGFATSFIVKLAITFKDVFFIYAFYLLFNHPTHKKIAIGVIVGSIAFLLMYSMAILSRNILFHTIFSLMLVLCLFITYSNDQIYQKLKKIVLGAIACIIGIIVFISVLRFFSDRNDAEYLQYVMLRYAGEPILNFGSWIDRIQEECHGVYNFSSFMSLFHIEPSRTFSEIRNYCYAQTHIPTHIFYTFIGTLVMDFGKITTFFIALTCALFFSKKRLEYTPFYRIAFLYIYSLNLLNGYFFFYFMSKNMQLLVAIVFLCFLWETDKNNIERQ